MFFSGKLSTIDGVGILGIWSDDRDELADNGHAGTLVVNLNQLAARSRPRSTVRDVLIIHDVCDECDYADQNDASKNNFDTRVPDAVVNVFGYLCVTSTIHSFITPNIGLLSARL